MWYWWLLLFSPEINLAIIKKGSCADIDCEHDDVNVCGVHADGSKVVAFRWFRDECAMRQAECEESDMKGYRSVNIQFCHQAFSLNTRRNKSFDGNGTEETQIEEENSKEKKKKNTVFDVTKPTYISTNPPCIQCDCNVISKSICAIRAENGRFILRSFPDECHMLQFNCENNLTFTVTDDFICFEDKLSGYANGEKTDRENKTPEDVENVELYYDNENHEEPVNKKCIQSDCVTDDEEICAVRPEGDRFIIRWFSDKCQMLQYNCGRRLNFTVIEDSICAGADSENHTDMEETQTIEIKDTVEVLDISDDTSSSENKPLGKEEAYVLKDSRELLETTASSSKEPYKLEEVREHRTYLNNVVVSTFDINENINQTVEKFFAASHTWGIPIQKVEDGDTRRMLVKDTGPVNVFVPRAFIPANYTPAENLKQNKQYPEYSPLVKYCYHKCPEKCPEFYRPVCGARIDNKKQTPFVFFKNHCYMDIAKCRMSWSGLKGHNYTELEEMGFIFCGGYKMMNMMYMYPLVRILQKMGRLKKKGRVHFILRNMGQFPIPLQG